jgi:hypothetical protein
MIARAASVAVMSPGETIGLITSCLLRCMSLLLAPNGHAAAVRPRLVLRVERTCPSSGPTSDFDPTETLVQSNDSALRAGFRPSDAIVLAARMPSP